MVTSYYADCMLQQSEISFFFYLINLFRHKKHLNRKLWLSDIVNDQTENQGTHIHPRKYLFNQEAIRLPFYTFLQDWPYSVCDWLALLIAFSLLYSLLSHTVAQ